MLNISELCSNQLTLCSKSRYDTEEITERRLHNLWNSNIKIVLGGEREKTPTYTRTLQVRLS